MLRDLLVRVTQPDIVPHVGATLSYLEEAMNQLDPALVFAGVLAFVVATPVTGQMQFFPDHATLPVNASQGAYLAATYARGLNDASTKTDAFAATVGVAVERLSFQGSAGFIASDFDELALGVAVGVDLISFLDTPVQLTLQGGVDWTGINVLGETVTNLRFPIGFVLKAPPLSATTVRVAPWVMPRLNIARASIANISSTSTDFGISGGIVITVPHGFGVHTAIDVLSGDGDPLMFSLGTHYVFAW